MRDARTGTPRVEMKQHSIQLHSVNTVANTRISPDGRLFAYVDVFAGRHVELVSLKPDEEELAYRRLCTQPNPSRYREACESARAAKDDFAAGFYLRLLPPPEQKVPAAEAAAEREIAAGRTQDALAHLAIAALAAALEEPGGAGGQPLPTCEGRGRKCGEDSWSVSWSTSASVLRAVHTTGPAAPLSPFPLGSTTGLPPLPGTVLLFPP